MHLLHKNLDNFLTKIDSPFSIDEVSGYLSGFASSNVPYDKYHNGLIIYFSGDGISIHDDLNSVYHILDTYLWCRYVH